MVIIIPVPYEQTTSYGKGAKRGPSAIISALNYVEDYDIDENKIVDKASIKILPALKGINTFQKLSKKIDYVTSKVLNSGNLPVFLGGEHTITAAVISAFKKHRHDFSILHFDAHSDLRDIYQGAKYSHACVMRRIFEMNAPAVSVGIRSQSLEEHKFIQKNGIHVFYASDIYKDKNWIKKVVNKLGKNIYISFDVDAFDPSIVRATGTPEPGGLTWHQVAELLSALKKSNKNLIGMDIVELSPVKTDLASSFTCAALLHKVLAIFVK